ncbi:MAG: class I SAM-dependent methyltransferase [Eubacterium sp.]|jgi:SAM-dependent methyltransferase
MNDTLNFAEAFRRGDDYPRKLLDIGCGLCLEGEDIIACGTSLVGVDQDGETIRKAQNRLPEADFFTADAALWLAGTATRFDAVLMRRPDLIFRSENWHAVFRRIPYVLKEGGRVIVTTPGRSEAELAAKWLRESAGNVRLTEINEAEEAFLVSAEDFMTMEKKENDRTRLIQDLAWEDDEPHPVCDLRTGQCTMITDKEENENENIYTERESDKT